MQYADRLVFHENLYSFVKSESIGGQNRGYLELLNSPFSLHRALFDESLNELEIEKTQQRR